VGFKHKNIHDASMAMVPIKRVVLRPPPFPFTFICMDHVVLNSITLQGNSYKQSLPQLFFLSNT
jgi:hypothetical protein